jgi:hypothetical protein
VSDTLELRNARAVVQSWVENMHLHSWNPAAHSMRPSELFTLAAEAHSAVRQTCDDQADILASHGFQSSHPEMRDLRTMASNAAHRATRHLQWAAALAQAEQEISYGSHGHE